ncbi:MAG: DUF2071 domain-containing protein [Verrucomicrobia bacterium]|nr:DUF2071 domain-containing protein [Verrucomicrobiota bacterium]
MADARPFLTAEWRWLAMLNYEAAPAVLSPFVPRGTELDSWNGRHYASIVGFAFQRTRVLGVPGWFHQDFEEVNLRFYVRRKAADGWRRGVVFVKELVPKALVTFVARAFYNENYETVPMRRELAMLGSKKQFTYSWTFRSRENRLHVRAEGDWRELEPGSEAEFITEHYWGYTRQRDGGTIEYQVEHPRWRVVDARESSLDCDVAGLYGEGIAACLRSKPVSAFLADGSTVTVYRGCKL